LSKAGIYTRNGDEGKTCLANKEIVSKTDCRIEAVGSLDELNSVIAILISCCQWSSNLKLYRSLQEDLFVIGAVIGGTQGIVTDKDRISYLEEMIDDISSKLPSLHNFILPGKFTEGAWLHFARAVCRRAERDVTRVQENFGNLDSNILVYLNRLSDLLFVMARKCNGMGRDDILWKKENSPFVGE
jgi:cob(I)alamin adenosyltransferase